MRSWKRSGSGGRRQWSGTVKNRGKKGKKQRVELSWHRGSTKNPTPPRSVPRKNRFYFLQSALSPHCKTVRGFFIDSKARTSTGQRAARSAPRAILPAIIRFYSVIRSIKCNLHRAIHRFVRTLHYTRNILCTDSFRGSFAESFQRWRPRVR